MAGRPMPIGVRRRWRWLATVGLGAVLAIVVVLIVWPRKGHSPGDPSDERQVALGKRLYAEHCSECHGSNLSGAPNWQSRLPNGRFPPPPHDDSGHTWHHADNVLFAITKHGLEPPIAPPGYLSDMPAFENVLPDDGIWAVLAFIKSTWPSTSREYQKSVTDQSDRAGAQRP